MKNVKRILALLLVLSIVFAFAACSKKAMIVGKWKAEEDGEVLYWTFDKDGKYTITGEEDGLALTGSYSIKGDKLTVTVSFMGESEDNEMTIKTLNGSKLVLEGEEDGKTETITFTKVK